MFKFTQSRIVVASTAAIATAAVTAGGYSAATAENHADSLNHRQERVVKRIVHKQARSLTHKQKRDVKRIVRKKARRLSHGQKRSVKKVIARYSDQNGLEGVGQTQDVYGTWMYADGRGRYSVAVCPEGTVPTGGGADADYWSSAANKSTENDGNVVITYSIANDSNGDGISDGWTVGATQRAGTTPPAGYRAEVQASAVCAEGTATARTQASVGSGSLGHNPVPDRSSGSR